MRLWGAPVLEPLTWREPVSPPGRMVAEPWLLTSTRFTVTDPSVWDTHTHHEHQLIWSGGGAVTVEAEGQLWMVPPVLGIWIPAGTPHHVRADSGAVMCATYFTPERVSVPWDGIVGITLTGVLRELLLYNMDEELPSDVRIRLQRLAVDLLRPVQAASLDIRMPVDVRLRRIATQIVADPADDRTTGDWAAWLGVSARTLTRSFTRETGLSLTQWRILVRVRAALIEIAVGRPVTTVAARLGYANPSTFIDLFRQITGHTPAAYFHSFTAVHQSVSKKR
ncbi:AraC family transcriptional regulator [Nonomuraea sp. NPDC046570]|uniref:helix-turn-helix domain-containing protein n=1 Tax=Nonomuraea sp. NPDC046570 TaxID=3155255 RepID=UPI0033C8CD89